MTQHPLAVGVLVVAGGTALAQPPAVVAPRPTLPAVTCTTDAPACGRVRLVGSAGQPFGLSVNSHFDGHVRAAEAARLVFHDYDFQADGSKLNYRGLDRVGEVARLLAGSTDPVVVERLPRDPKLAEQRRLAVLTALAEAAPGVDPSRVVVGVPAATPLRGSEAVIVHQTMLRMTASGGYLPSGGGTTGLTAGGASPTGGQPSSPNTPSNR